MFEAVTGFRFHWTGRDGVQHEYKADLPDVNGVLRLPDRTILMIRGCKPFKPTPEELASIAEPRKLPFAELIR